MVADELRRQADQFVDLADLEPLVCRDPSARVAREPRTYPARGQQYPTREGAGFQDSDDLSEEV